MEKTRMFKVIIAATAITAFSGCASNGNFDQTLASLKTGAGTAIGVATDVAKNVGGALVPDDYVTGVYVSDEALASLKPGMSASEVEAIIGLAPDVSAVAGKEVWKYPYAKLTAAGAYTGGNVNETTIVRFNKAGKLAKAYKVQGGGGAASGNPLLQAAEAQGSF